MGCANSKQSQCRHCKMPYSPRRPDNSMPFKYSIRRKSDERHVVSVNSTTSGSFKLDLIDQNQNQNHVDRNNIDYHDEQKKDKKKKNNNSSNDNKGEELSMEVTQEKNWSNMINKTIPKTPTRTPPGEPEIINTWELMEGLESPTPQSNLVDPCISFHFVPDATPFDQSKPALEDNVIASLKPMWLQISGIDSITNSKSAISDFDPEIISAFRNALEELSPQPPENEKIVPFDHKPLFSKDSMDTKNVNDIITTFKCPPYGENKVVIYFTSLRGVRKTYEDCCHVRMILKGMILKGSSIRIDERDVSMHYRFREELKELLGDGSSGGLPRVFVKGRYIGGVDEVRRMHEDGELEKVLEGCELVQEGGGGGRECEVCGDVRFVLCERCLGSCKIYYEGDEDGEEWVEGFQRCPHCNENGIVRCPVCCY